MLCQYQKYFPSLEPAHLYIHRRSANNHDHTDHLDHLLATWVFQTRGHLYVSVKYSTP